MKRIYCVICGKYRKFKNPEISYIFQKLLVPFLICSKCKNENGNIFKEEESIKTLKTLSLMKNI